MNDFNEVSVRPVTYAEYIRRAKEGMPLPFSRISKQAICDAHVALMAQGGKPPAIEEVLSEVFGPEESHRLNKPVLRGPSTLG